ncbi:aspartic peptidase domain-containing protein [Fomitopsis serialis]|uniref:aspartic peptidase domain-containing protein n=1 Tax=Fomitopsis serialis TaxID=139415 RepID=UPI0020073FD6|nr:aspartic peptidase domain-containing protein [Neoantrodia serialis]KAH9916027.1 aspartic peptidase domain-containing protein [Neoantrodia serialis]
MYHRLLSFSFLAATVLSSVFAIHIPLCRNAVSIRDASPHRISVTKSASSTDLSGFVNYANGRYSGNITIAGQSLEVVLDTGSSDLWIISDSALPGSVNTSIPAEHKYGTDAANGASIQGYIFTADVEFGGFTIAQQAYIDVPNSSVSSGVVAPGMSGLIGLSPVAEIGTVAADLQKANYNASGANPMQNIFYNDPSIKPQFTILMSRNDGKVETSGGVFTIGDPVPELASIQDAPILPVGHDDDEILAQHWTVHMDAIVINGQSYNTSSSGVANLSAILDTGTPTALVDPRFVDIMFGANAQPIQTDFSVVDCNTQINISFVFGGIEFPIHPIDAIQPVALDDNGTVICSGSFGRLEGLPDGLLLLGDTFLRNAYTLYNLNIGNSSPVGPYVQMLSTTDAEAAATEFAQLNQQRLCAFAAAQSNSSSSATVDHDDDELSAAGAVSSPSPSSSSSSSDDYSALMRNSYIIIGLMGGALLLLIIIAAMLDDCCRCAGYLPAFKAYVKCPERFDEYYIQDPDAAAKRDYDKWGVIPERARFVPRVYKVKGKVVGCWDTVASLERPLSNAGGVTGHCENYDGGLHLPDKDEVAKSIDLRQCWFSGVHTNLNVGGGYPDQALADLALAWMIDLCSPYPDFDPKYIKIRTRMASTATTSLYRWACGKLYSTLVQEGPDVDVAIPHAWRVPQAGRPHEREDARKYARTMVDPARGARLATTNAEKLRAKAARGWSVGGVENAGGRKQPKESFTSEVKAKESFE